MFEVKNRLFILSLVVIQLLNISFGKYEFKLDAHSVFKKSGDVSYVLLSDWLTWFLCQVRIKH